MLLHFGQKLAGVEPFFHAAARFGAVVSAPWFRHAVFHSSPSFRRLFFGETH